MHTHWSQFVPNMSSQHPMTLSSSSSSSCGSDRTQELCDSRGGCPGLPVPDKPYGFCGRKATLNHLTSVLVWWSDRAMVTLTKTGAFVSQSVVMSDGDWESEWCEWSFLMCGGHGNGFVHRSDWGLGSDWWRLEDKWSWDVPVWFSVQSLAVVVSARNKCTGVRVEPVRLAPTQSRLAVRR